jgi:hypothetical protein
VGTLRYGGMGIFECGGGQGCSRRGAVSSDTSESKTTKRIGTKFGKASCRLLLLLSILSTLGAGALALCARRTTLRLSPFNLLTGCLIIDRDVTGLAVLLPAGLVRLTAYALSSRLCPYNGITCG